MLIFISEQGKMFYWDEEARNFLLLQPLDQPSKKDRLYSAIKASQREISQKVVPLRDTQRQESVSIFPLPTLLKFSEIEKRMGFSRRTLDRRIKAKLWTKPVRISANRVAWPALEVRMLIQAYIAGRSKSEIARLVERLEITRKWPTRRPILR
jgi:predicted DNA-binding transcriptional regulator AlpA